MQKHYEHSVPCDDECVSKEKRAEENRRTAIVFRRGLQEKQKIDSGKPSACLQPRPLRPYIVGNDVDGLFEGSTYTRTQLIELNAHR
jgi:hypothetical protein